MKLIFALIVFASLSAWAQDAAKLEADLNAHPDHMNTRMQLATNYAQQAKYDKVITLLNPYTDQLPNEGFLALASSYSNKKDYTNEVRVLSLLSNKHEEDYRWHMLLAQAYIKLANSTTDAEKKKDHTTSGIQQLRKVLQIEKKYKPAFDLLLDTMLVNKLNNEARELLSEGLTKFGERPELYREICRLDSTDGFLVQAIASCRKSIHLSPTFPDSYVYLVQSLNDQGETQQAEKDVVVAARRFPKSEFVQWASGTLFLKRKNYPVATRYFKTALGADPKSGRAHYGLAQSLFESGEEQAALEHFIAACKDDGSTVDTFYAAAGKLKQKGNYKLGDQFSQQAGVCRNK